MGFFYFDESKHDKNGFTLGAFVYHPTDVTQIIYDLLSECGFQPSEDEFKSGAHMGRNPKQAELRLYMKRLLLYCKVGVVIVSDSSTLGVEALYLLKKILTYPKLNLAKHNVYFDEGLFSSPEQAKDKATSLSLTEVCEFNFEQDSKIIAGIQLADLAAHMCAIMLRESLGHVDKTVKAGENSGYDPDTDINIGFELWAGIRYSFFAGPTLNPNLWDESDTLQPTVDVKPYGL